MDTEQQRNHKRWLLGANLTFIYFVSEAFDKWRCVRAHKHGRRGCCLCWNRTTFFFPGTIPDPGIPYHIPTETWFTTQHSHEM